MNTNEKVFTVTEFAKRINSSRPTVLRMIKEGSIIAFRLSNAKRSSFRIKESEIDRLISLELNRKAILDKRRH